MGFTVRRLIPGVVVVAGSMAGCGNPDADLGPDNSRLTQGSEVVLYDPNVAHGGFLTARRGRQTWRA